VLFTARHRFVAADRTHDSNAARIPCASVAARATPESPPSDFRASHGGHVIRSRISERRVPFAQPFVLLA
jgi:hypothetical protein